MCTQAAGSLLEPLGVAGAHQENDCLLIEAGDRGLLEAVAARERCGLQACLLRRFACSGASGAASMIKTPQERLLPFDKPGASGACILLAVPSITRQRHFRCIPAAPCKGAAACCDAWHAHHLRQRACPVWPHAHSSVCLRAGYRRDQRQRAHHARGQGSAARRAHPCGPGP